jgi:hypothetical protein
VNIDRVVTAAQITLSIIYLSGYLWLLYLFANGAIKTPAEWRDQMSVLMGVLTTGVPSILQFWFARSRASEKPPTGQP